MIPDANPVFEGHMLVLPRRHVARAEEISADELSAMLGLVREVMRRSSAAGADGFNVGINDGVTAGQTVLHAHIHVIPRRHGDCEDPRGGVRWVAPSRAAYWRHRDR